MIKNYLKISWRSIKKHPGFSLLNAGGLTLGIASCLLLLLYVSYHMSYDHQFANLDNIYITENNQPGDGKIYTFASTPGQFAPAAKSVVPGVVRSARATNYTAGGLISYNDHSFEKDGLFADPDFLAIFSYHFIEGNAASALTQSNSIVITKQLEQTLFGNKRGLNKVIIHNNILPLKVTGVIDNLPGNTTYQFDYILPYVQFENANAWTKTSDWGSNFCQTFIQLKDPSALGRANKILATIVAKHATGNKNQLFLFPFAKMHLYEKFENGKSVGGLIEQMHLFEILALCILLIACVNFMNLSTARSEERAKEVGIRKAIGSGRSALVWQFIVESLILSFLSTIAALIVLIVCIPYFNNLLNIKLVLPVSEWYGWLLLMSLAVFTGLISGSYPAFYLSSFRPIKVLKGVFRGGSSALPVRKILVVVQFAFAVFLITATICIYRQMRFIQSRSNGYDKNNLVEIPVEGTLDKKAEALITELKRNGAITHATNFSKGITQNGSNTWGIDWPGKNENQEVLFDIFHAGFDFTSTTGVKLLAGREFSTAYSIDTAGKTAMINETAASLMNLKHPIGSVIKWGDQTLTVIGIYKDFVWGSPYQKTPPMISMCVGYSGQYIALRLNANKSIVECISQINKALKNVNPAYPPNIHFVDSEFEKKFQSERILSMMANLFGGLSIVISCLGLFGLAAYAAEQRTKEIGVRKVLGATVMNLATLLSKDFLILVLIAIVPATLVSIWLLNNWLNTFELRTTLSWWIIASASAVTIVIALLTVSYQAVKAALANPVNSLRSE